MAKTVENYTKVCVLVDATEASTDSDAISIAQWEAGLVESPIDDVTADRGLQGNWYVEFTIQNDMRPDCCQMLSTGRCATCTEDRALA